MFSPTLLPAYAFEILLSQDCPGFKAISLGLPLVQISVSELF